MTRKSNTWNAYESSLTGPFLIGSTTMQLDSTLGLQEPLYLVIDPDVPAKREWIRGNTINGNAIENVVRGLEGSVGTPNVGVDHDAGAKVRAVFSKQHLDDIFLDLNDVEQGLIGPTGHIPDPNDPHSAAGYVKLTTADGRYVNKLGDTMTGPLNLVPPTADANAATKKYVDDNLFDGNHASLSGVSADQHHTKYTDGEAITAMGSENINNALNHGRYTDPEAVDAFVASSQYTDILARLDALEAGAPPASHTHIASDTISGAFADARIPNLNASKVTAGVFTVARIPNLNANKITAGTFGAGSFTFPGLVGHGSLEVAGSVVFTGLAVNAAGVELRLNAGILAKAT